MERKNPLGAVEAFARAFRRDERVTLWLRATNALGAGCRAQLRRLVDRAAATGLDIRLDVGPRSRAEILRLLAASDAYLSLHRAEGFGYTCAEAMALGVPTIATGYSGNLEFMTSGNSYLVEASECEVRIPDGPFVRGSLWAEPDLAHAAERMRQVLLDREEARSVARRGREEVRRQLAPARVGALCARLLGEGPTARFEAAGGPSPREARSLLS
jgi:glycosyltransferase involved in cell wall biosynthesis